MTDAELHECRACAQVLPNDEFSRSQLSRKYKRCWRCIEGARPLIPVGYFLPIGERHQSTWKLSDRDLVGAQVFLHSLKGYDKCLNGKTGVVDAVDVETECCQIIGFKGSDCDFYISVPHHNVMRPSEILDKIEMLEKSLANATPSSQGAEEDTRAGPHVPAIERSHFVGSLADRDIAGAHVFFHGLKGESAWMNGRFGVVTSVDSQTECCQVTDVYESRICLKSGIHASVLLKHVMRPSESLEKIHLLEKKLAGGTSHLDAVQEDGPYDRAENQQRQEAANAAAAFGRQHLLQDEPAEARTESRELFKQIQQLKLEQGDLRCDLTRAQAKEDLLQDELAKEKEGNRELRERILQLEVEQGDLESDLRLAQVRGSFLQDELAEEREGNRELLEQLQSAHRQLPIQKKIASPLDKSCSVAMNAKKFLRSLDFPDVYFNAPHDRCYCKSCYKPAYPDMMGKGGTKYIVPRGWVGFALHVPQRALDLGSFEKWSVSYHGTKPSVASTILRDGCFAVPGDKLVDGTVLRSRNSAARQDNHFYTSPTVNYAGLQLYAEPTEWVSQSGEPMIGQIVLMCKQDEDTLKRKQSETMGFRKHKFKEDHVCKHTPLSADIEWLSNTRSGCIPYRILVRTFRKDDVPEHVRSPHDREPGRSSGHLWV